MLIYVDTPLNNQQKEDLKTKEPKETFVFKDELDGKDEQLANLLKADIVFGNPKPIEAIRDAKNLKWIQLYSTGFEYYRNLNIAAAVTNMQDYYSQPCAETAVAGIMALYRGMDVFGVLKENKQWVGHKVRTDLHLLLNRKVIILGWGNIGKRVGRILSGFDCELRIYARTAPEADVRTVEDLESQVSWADIIIGCLPGTVETTGLFTKNMIRQMKAGSVFCNVGRGNLLEDEQALIDSLKTGKIGGAVLDVTAEEPIPPDHPLWDCPNTILSQHSAGGNSTEYDGIVAFFLENFDKFKKGISLMNVVDLKKGY